LQRELFQIYAKARGWLVKKTDLSLLVTATKTSLQDRWRRFHKKIFRNCTACKKINKLFQRGMYVKKYQSPHFLNVLYNPDKVFSDPNTVFLKKGRSTTVAKIKIDDRFFVIKRYNLKNSIHWLRRCLRETRAKAAWRLAQRLTLMGVPTANPVAYVEKHFFGLNRTSYFLMEFIPGLTSKEFFTMYQPDDSQYLFIAGRLVALFRALNELRLTHGDLKHTNIIIHEQQPKLIDLDGMCEHTLTAPLQRAYKKELQRFMRNWQDQPSVFALFEGLLNKVIVN